MRRNPFPWLILLLWCAPLPSWGGIHFDAAKNHWTLTSGPVEFRLVQREGSVFVSYLGPAGGADWKPLNLPGGQGRPDFPWNIWETAGKVNDLGLYPADLFLTSQKVNKVGANIEELILSFQHRQLKLTLEVHYKTWGETGVLTRQVILANQGVENLRVQELPSLAFRFPAGSYDLSYLHGGWGRERQLATEPIGAGRRTLGSRSGRSSNGFSPWFCLYQQNSGIRYLGQLAYSGNWKMNFSRQPATIPLENLPLAADLGIHFDFGGPLILRPGHTFQTPLAAFTATAGDLDDGANQLHRFQREFIVPRQATNTPPLVQFNSWYPFPGKMTAKEMMSCADIAADLGAEVFVLDAGWFNKKNWSTELGDWQVDVVAFPNGLEELSRHVHGKGMKFGLWVEIENLGIESQMLREHPDWCLSFQGKPVLIENRCTLNFSKKEVQTWAHGVIDRLVRSYQLDWIKIDYNNDVEDRFDPPSPEQGGEVHYGHVTAYYHWLDEVRLSHPNLIIENCASGGMRFDLGIIGHTHTTWISDVILPKPSLQLAYGSTLEFTPAVCNHWMVGDKDNGEINPANSRGWWEFMLRVPMNGQFGISSRVFDWPEALKQTARTEINRYKRIRQVIAEADTYHLTASPDHDQPEGWMALQYVAKQGGRSVVNIYRLGNSEAEQTFRLRGLDNQRVYRISINGDPGGSKTGEELSREGLAIQLPEQWRAAVVELESR